MLKTLVQQFIYTDAPFPECHASTVAQAGGDLVAAWFGGTGEKFPDVGIWLSRRDGSGAWSPPRRVAKVAEIAHWNPALFAAPDGRLHLYFKVGVDVPSWVTWTSVSDDGGVTWSAPRELVPGDTSGGRGPVKNKPILLSDGAWLAGASTEQGRWRGFVDRSDDDGATWQRSDFFDDSALPPARRAEYGVIQPALWESSPGNVHLLIRSACGWMPRADSADGGRTWSPLYPSGLPNNNSGLDVVKMNDGTLALIYNPVAEDWGARTPLRISLSFDNGATWPESLDIETEKNNGEFSYPAIIADGNNLYATYTWKRKRIAFWHGAVT